MNKPQETRPRCAEACTCETPQKANRPANERAAGLCGCGAGCTCGSECRCGR